MHFYDINHIFFHCHERLAFQYLYFFNRGLISLSLPLQDTTFGNLFVYDRDTTTYQSQDNYVSTLMTNDSWIKETFTIEQKFSEEKSIFGNVRGTVYKYSKDAEALCLV